MIVRDPGSIFSRFGEFVEENMGLHFPPERIDDLRRGVTAAAPEFGFQDIEACIRWLMATPLDKGQVEILAGHLTVGETYFFRDKNVFAALEEQVLPTLIKSQNSAERQLRIWSAACCSGEEPYSIAISVRKSIPDTQGWQISILGTDINPRFLKKASKGVFSEWSFRDTSKGFKEAYFKKIEEGRWEIRHDVRKMVTFSQLNLVEDSYPSLLNKTNGLDVIFCRNVLIYFSPEHARRVVLKLTRCLRDGGWLILGPNETMHVTFADLTSVRLPGAIFYRKLATPSRPAQNEVLLSEYEPEQNAENYVEVAKAAIEETPGCSLHEGVLGLYQGGRYDEVIQMLRERKLDAQMMSLLTRSLANQGKLNDALSSSDEMIAADKLNPIGHYLRGMILQEQGNVSEAESAFKRALYLQPDFILAHFGLANLERSQGRMAESKRHFRNALALASARPPDEILPEGDGITAGRLMEIIASIGQSRLEETNA